MGRPTKLTPDVQKTICDLIANGNTRECAAGCAGIDPATLYRWMADPDNREFREAIEKADAQAEARNVLVIHKAAADTWQAAAWWLERRRYENYGKRDRTELGGIPAEAGGQPIKIVQLVLDGPEGEEDAGGDDDAG